MVRMNDSTALSCRELVEIITDYLEGALPEGDRARFEAHLATCEGCRTYLEQMRLTIQVVGRLTEESIPSSIREELLEAFHTWSRR